jgi:hypothetical protein
VPLLLDRGREGLGSARFGFLVERHGGVWGAWAGESGNLGGDAVKRTTCVGGRRESRETTAVGVTATRGGDQ